MSSQKEVGGSSTAKYRELAQKWTSISNGLDSESYERKEALEDRVKKLEDQVLKEQPEEDPRFKVQRMIAQLLRDEIVRVRQDITDDQQETLSIVDRKEEELTKLTAALTTLQQNQEEQKKLNENQIVSTVDSKIMNIQNAMAKQNRQGSTGVEERRQLARHQLNLIREELENQRRHREESMRVLTEEIESELVEFQEQLAVERRVRQQSQLKLFGMIQEVSEQLKQQLAAEQQERETTNECLLKLLEDTCAKIHQHFSL